MLPAYKGGVVMAIVAVPALWAASELGQAPALAITTIAGAAAYLATLARFARADLRRMLGWAGLGRLMPAGEAD